MLVTALVRSCCSRVWPIAVRINNLGNHAMKFPKFWARTANLRGTVSARGWSDISLEEAQSNANLRLQRILQWLRTEHDVGEPDRYAYEADGVICEEIIEQIDDSPNVSAIVSRNRYGALVLNVSRLMFVDIDLPTPANRGCLLAWWPPGKPSAENSEQAILARVDDWQSRNTDMTLRVYRTCNGIRLMVVNHLFVESDPRAAAIMEELQADRLYRHLCRTQSCYRARLTPKPWRVGLSNPPTGFPFDRVEDRQRFEDWNQRYLQAIKNYAVCRFLKTLGTGETLADHLPIIELHDQFCCRAPELPLA